MITYHAPQTNTIHVHPKWLPSHTSILSHWHHIHFVSLEKIPINVHIYIFQYMYVDSIHYSVSHGVFCTKIGVWLAYTFYIFRYEQFYQVHVIVAMYPHLHIIYAIHPISDYSSEFCYNIWGSAENISLHNID